VKDKIFISSTFGGETLSLAACIATIAVLRGEPVHKRLWEVGTRLKEGFNELARSAGSGICCVGLPPRLGFVFPSNSSASSDALKTLFMQEVVKRGVYFVWNMLPSYATTDQDIRASLEAFDESLRICVAAERHDDVRNRLEGKTPIVVI
jgi:glutamate-1-semialdehyde aminotransferase